MLYREAEEIATGVLTDKSMTSEQKIAELRMIEFTGTQFHSREDALLLINELNAIYDSTGGDPTVRAVAEETMERMIGELRQDEENHSLDDDAPVMGALDDDDSDDDLDPEDENTPDLTNAAMGLAAYMGAAGKKITKRQRPMKKETRTDLLLNIADSSNSPTVRELAITAAGDRIEKYGATDAQTGTLIGLSSISSDPEVRTSSAGILAKLFGGLEHPKPGSGHAPSKKLQDG